MPPHVTVRKLAQLAGCSQTTVSMALRNHAKISQPTRDRIQRLAREHGYMRDPVVSSLMNRLRVSRPRRGLEKLALINWWNAPGIWREDERGRELHAGLQERAGELGYACEEFWAAEPGLTTARLTKILHARGIRGVVLLSKFQPRGRASLHWPFFAAATNNYTIVAPNLHRASHSHYQGAVLALRSLRHRGYTRVGYLNLLAQEDRVNDGWLAGYLAYNYRVHRKLEIPPLLASGWDRAEIERWLKKHRPEVVISVGDEVPRLLRGLGFRIPEDIGYVSLDRTAGESSVAGIDQLRKQVGRKVVELVVEQLEGNELGLPAHPKTVLIDGVWRDGPTLGPSGK